MSLFWDSLKTGRDLGRVQDIVTILIKWGFGDLVHRSGLGRLLQKAGKIFHSKESESITEIEPPERLCLVLQELGPTFVKLGQVLATRVDLFSEEWINAFEQLHDDVKTVPLAELKQQLEASLGEPLAEIFSEFEEEPFAAASIAQVHRARLHSGEQVILKIRRPGIVETVEADLRLLARLAELVEENIEELKRYQPAAIVRQFSHSLKRELDLINECHNAERIARNMESVDFIAVPKVYWDWTRVDVNVQEYFAGYRGTEVVKRRPTEIDASQVAEQGAYAILHMVLEDGLFHADPHLGNFIILADGKIGLIDFGMVGHLSPKRRDQITDLLYALVRKDSEKVVDVLEDWTQAQTSVHETLLIDIDNFLERYHGLELQQIDFTALLRDLLAIIRSHQLVLPSDLALLFKTFITLEGVGRRLDPRFNIVEQASPYLTRIMRKRYRPDVLFKRGAMQSMETLSILAELPRESYALLKSMRRKGISVHADLSRLDNFGHQIDTAVSRLTVGIIIAALIIGSAIVTVTENEKSSYLGLPPLGFTGFVVAMLGAFWLLISIWRGRK